MTRLLAVLALAAGPAMADPVEGLWRTQANDEGSFADVLIAPCGQALCGRLQRAYDASGSPIVPPDPDALIVAGMQPVGGGAYEGGTITDPQADRTYSAKMALSGDSLRVSGCVAGGLLCRSQTWQRVR